MSALPRGANYYPALAIPNPQISSAGVIIDSTTIYNMQSAPINSYFIDKEQIQNEQIQNEHSHYWL